MKKVAKAMINYERQKKLKSNTQIKQVTKKEKNHLKLKIHYKNQRKNLEMGKMKQSNEEKDKKNREIWHIQYLEDIRGRI